MQRYLRSGLLPALVLATIIGVGCSLAWTFGCSLVTIARQIGRFDRNYEYLVINADGEALIRTMNNRIDRYRTLSGQPVESGRATRQVANTVYLRDATRWNWANSGQVAWDSRLSGIRDSSTPGVMWYLVHAAEPNGLAYLVGYDSHSQQRIGYLGLGGFRAEVPPDDEQFRIPGGTMYSGAVTGNPNLNSGAEPSGNTTSQSEIYLLSDRELLKVDLNQRIITRLEAPENLTSLALAWLRNRGQDDEDDLRQKQLFARGGDTIYQFSSSGAVDRSITVPQHAEVDLTLYITDAKQFIISAGDDDTMRVYWFDAEGKVSRQEEVRLARPAEMNPKLAAFGITLMSPSVLSDVLTVYTIVAENVYRGKAPDYPTGLRQVLVDWWPALVLLTIVSAALAAWVYRRHRALGLPAAAVWAGFVFVTGLPGLVGYWTHRHWPVRETCPHCGQSVPRDRLHCAACSVEFATPPLKGIEVFA